TRGREQAAGSHDDLARNEDAAATEDHEREGGDQLLGRDEVADGCRETVWTCAAFTPRKGRMRTCWSSIMISKLEKPGRLIGTVVRLMTMLAERSQPCGYSGGTWRAGRLRTIGCGSTGFPSSSAQWTSTLCG